MIRLRQVALVARDLEPVAKELQAELGLGEPYRDPGVGAFGLENVVFAVGDTFLEVVSPTKDGTTAGRYLDRRGGDGGYMAIFQVGDLAAARERVERLGVRVVWQADRADIAGTHLHPKDVPGAIVSLDWADPPESWRWAGPSWTGAAPGHPAGGITAITVEVDDVAATRRRWAAVLGITSPTDAALVLSSGDAEPQTIEFVAASGSGEGISQVTVALPERVRRGREEVSTCGLRIRLVTPAEKEL